MTFKGPLQPEVFYDSAKTNWSVKMATLMHYIIFGVELCIQGHKNKTVCLPCTVNLNIMFVTGVPN